MWYLVLQLITVVRKHLPSDHYVLTGLGFYSPFSLTNLSQAMKKTARPRSRKKGADINATSAQLLLKGYVFILRFSRPGAYEQIRGSKISSGSLAPDLHKTHSWIHHFLLLRQVRERTSHAVSQTRRTENPFRSLNLKISHGTFGRVDYLRIQTRFGISAFIKAQRFHFPFTSFPSEPLTVTNRIAIANYAGS